MLFLSKQDVDKMVENIDELKDDVNDLKTHRIECDDRHRRHDDKIEMIMNQLGKICDHTEAIARGDAAKEIVRQFIFSLAKLLGALGIILASVWHGLDYVIKLASVAH